MKRDRFHSWGLYPPACAGSVAKAASREIAGNDIVLPFGCGRSYGDVCLNNDHTLLDTSSLSHILSLDAATGLLTCEAGVTLGAILARITREGWFLPVIPGTQFVSVGGAIANDVLGKNHTKAGTFGAHVETIDLLRSKEGIIECSRTKNFELFAATVGGLGLTGLILRATIRLKKASPAFRTETRSYRSAAECFEALQNATASHEYGIAWIDCLSLKHFGRSIVTVGDHTNAAGITHTQQRQRAVPALLLRPFFRRSTMRLYNALRFRAWKRKKTEIEDYSTFLFPLDGITNWNELYGCKGFVQYQCAVSPDAAVEVLKKVRQMHMPAYLVSARACGGSTSPGMLSFPKKGISIALDFPHYGAQMFDDLRELDSIVASDNGRLYPAKDARMSSQMFKSCFRHWKEFSKHVDSRFSSGFWRRVVPVE